MASPTTGPKICEYVMLMWVLGMNGAASAGGTFAGGGAPLVGGVLGGFGGAGVCEGTSWMATMCGRRVGRRQHVAKMVIACLQSAGICGIQKL